MNPAVDFYFNKAKKWQEELKALRPVILGCGLTEELKWGVPCYTFENDKNSHKIVLIHAFKDYCALLYFKGALLKTAFEALTPGRQRAYFLHFAAPKQAKTRVARVEKCMPHILNGKGLMD